MKIVSLELFKYKRFFLNNIEHVIYKPESNVQIILGTNGSGKSSLLNMLTPLPANISKDFLDGGYKVIIIEHNGLTYTLTSGVKGTLAHSFKINNIEYNTGGTKVVQLKLVDEHFKLTPSRQDILLGVKGLTNMSSNERKDIFTNISDIDYAYAFEVYNKLKQRYRDITGAIKVQNDRLSQIEKNNITLSTVEKLETDIMWLKRMLELLLEYYQPSLIVKDTDTIVTNVKVLLNKLINTPVVSTDISSDIKSCENRLSVLSVLIKNTQEELEVKHSMIEKIKHSSVDINNIDAELLKAKSEASKLKVTLNIPYLDTSNLSVIHKDFIYYYQELNSLLANLVNYTSVNVLSIDISAVELKLITEKSNTKKLSAYIKDLEANIVSYKKLKDNSNKIECDKCGNSWYAGYNEVTEEELLKKLETATKNLEIAEVNHDKLLEIYNGYKSKHSAILKIKEIFNKAPSLDGVYSYLFNNTDIMALSNVAPVINKLETVYNILLLVPEYIYLKKKIEQLETLNKEMGVYKLDSVNDVNNLEKKLLDYNVEKVDISKKLIELKKTLELLVSSQATYKQLETDLKKYSSTVKNNLKVIDNDGIKKMISYVKQEIIIAENKLIDNKQLGSRINTIKEELKELNNKEVVLKVMMEELSPTSGLIAESINGFINSFINNMNVFIKLVWSYDIAIQPFRIMDDQTLDYKFSVIVNNEEPINDVSMLSSSMQNIIDLAFKVTYMQYLNFTNYPLTLDEFGRTFDTKHRIAAFDVVDNYLGKTFQQLFIVSHFEENYMRFGNADISVLHNDNISIENLSSYNTVLHYK